MRIDVVMTVCEGSRHLEEQLRSLGEQIRVPDRLIVRDDASTDGSLRTLTGFAEDAPFPVEIVRGTERIGSIRSFEQALALSDGDVVALCDQDDSWETSKLRHVERAFSHTPRPGLVFSDASLVGADGRLIDPSLWRKLGVDPCGMTPHGLFLRSHIAPFVPGCTLAFDGDLRSLILPFPPSLSTADVGMQHDGWIVALAAATTGFVALPTPLISYRVHPSQQIGLPDHPARRLVDRLADVASNGGDLATRRRQRESAARLTRERLSQRFGGESPAASLIELDAMIEHLAMRSDIATGARRIRAVVRELRSGRYRRFSSGWSSALIDLSQRTRTP